MSPAIEKRTEPRPLCGSLDVFFRSFWRVHFDVYGNAFGQHTYGLQDLGDKVATPIENDLFYRYAN